MGFEPRQPDQDICVYEQYAGLRVESVEQGGSWEGGVSPPGIQK